MRNGNRGKTSYSPRKISLVSPEKINYLTFYPKTPKKLIKMQVSGFQNLEKDPEKELANRWA